MTEDRRAHLVAAIQNVAKIRSLHERKLDLYDEMYRALAQEIMKMDNMSFGDREFRALLKAYNEQLKASKRGSDTFTVELKGVKREFLVQYAYYVLEHLHNQGFGVQWHPIQKPTR